MSSTDTGRTVTLAGRVGAGSVAIVLAHNVRVAEIGGTLGTDWVRIERLAHAETWYTNTRKGGEAAVTVRYYPIAGAGTPHLGLLVGRVIDESDG